MTAFYIGQQTTRRLSPTTSNRQCRLSKSTADVISPKPAHMKCSKANGRAASSLSNFRASRRSRIGTRLPAAGRQTACGGAQHHDHGMAAREKPYDLAPRFFAFAAR